MTATCWPTDPTSSRWTRHLQCPTHHGHCLGNLGTTRALLPSLYSSRSSSPCVDLAYAKIYIFYTKIVNYCRQLNTHLPGTVLLFFFQKDMALTLSVECPPLPPPLLPPPPPPLLWWFSIPNNTTLILLLISVTTSPLHRVSSWRREQRGDTLTPRSR